MRRLRAAVVDNSPRNQGTFVISHRRAHEAFHIKRFVGPARRLCRVFSARAPYSLNDDMPTQPGPNRGARLVFVFLFCFFFFPSRLRPPAWTRFGPYRDLTVQILAVWTEIGYYRDLDVPTGSLLGKKATKDGAKRAQCNRDSSRLVGFLSELNWYSKVSSPFWLG